MEVPVLALLYWLPFWTRWIFVEISGRLSALLPPLTRNAKQATAHASRTNVRANWPYDAGPGGPFLWTDQELTHKAYRSQTYRPCY